MSVRTSPVPFGFFVGYSQGLSDFYPSFWMILIDIAAAVLYNSVRVLKEDTDSETSSFVINRGEQMSGRRQSTAFLNGLIKGPIRVTIRTIGARLSNQNISYKHFLKG
ncbi:MAG: hypothetical protein ABFR90_07150 [Planctomycetota bacterium]